MRIFPGFPTNFNFFDRTLETVNHKTPRAPQQHTVSTVFLWYFFVNNFLYEHTYSIVYDIYCVCIDFFVGYYHFVVVFSPCSFFVCVVRLCVFFFRGDVSGLRGCGVRHNFFFFSLQ
jgi:hypothetical protein